MQYTLARMRAMSLVYKIPYLRARLAYSVCKGQVRAIPNDACSRVLGLFKIRPCVVYKIPYRRARAWPSAKVSCIQGHAQR